MSRPPFIVHWEQIQDADQGLLRQHERHADGRFLDSLIYARIAG